MFDAARRQPRPRYRFISPSRSSKASAPPVDAPEGTDAEALTPPSRVHVANTVGLPRLSSTSRPASRSIGGIGFDFVNKLVDQIRNAPRRRCHQLDDDVLLPSH